MTRTDAEAELLHRIGRAIARQRAQLGWTQDRLGAVLGISVKNVQRLESGRPDLRATTLLRVATALGTTLPALMSAQDQAPAAPSDQRHHGPWAGLRALGWTPVRSASATAVPVWDLRPCLPSDGAQPATQRPLQVGFALPPAGHQPLPGSVLVRVHGTAMLPHIAPGTWCLFVQPVRELRNGAAVLARLGGHDHPQYAVRWLAMAQPTADGTALTLRAAHGQVAELRVTAREPADVVVAELAGVLSASSPAKPRRPRAQFDGSGASV